MNNASSSSFNSNEAKNVRIHQNGENCQENKMVQSKAEEDLANEKQKHEKKADEEMQMKIEQKKEVLAKIANRLDEDTEELIITEEALGVAQASLAKNKTDIQEFPKKKVIALDNYKNLKEIDFDKKKADFERDDEEIRQAIETTETTGQNEEPEEVLRLTQNLITATMDTQAHTNNLDTKLRTFNDLIATTISNHKLTVEDYFAEQNMSRFVPILAAEDMHDLDDLKCDNDEEFEDILELIQNGLEEALAKWQEKHNDDDAKNSNGKAPSIKINDREKRTLKMICLKYEKTWIKQQNDKHDIVKRSLVSMCPVLGKFFERCFEGMNQVQEMLSVDIKLNDKQRKAIKMIEYVNDDDDDDDDVDVKDNDDDDLWDVASDVQIYSDTQQKWFIGQIVKVFTDDDDGEWLNVQYPTQTDTIYVNVQRGSDKVKALDIKKMKSKNEVQIAENEDDLNDELVVECRALTKAATLTMAVIKTMEGDFEKDEDTKRSKSIAISVEESCKQIIITQGSIRQLVLLAQKIMSLKPSNMEKETAQKLWSSLGELIVHIFNSALKMAAVFVEYFQFFLKFQTGFQFFQSCYKDGKYKETDLIVSCESIRKHTRRFCEFSKEFSKTVERLRTDAMNCIESCVKTQKGYECTENARKSRKKTVDLYLVAKAKVDAKSYELDQKLEDYLVKRTSLSGKEKGLMCKRSVLQNRIKHNKEYLKQLQMQNDYFMNLNINNNNNKNKQKIVPMDINNNNQKTKNDDINNNNNQNENQSRKRKLSYDNEINNNKKRKLG